VAKGIKKSEDDTKPTAGSMVGLRPYASEIHAAGPRLTMPMVDMSANRPPSLVVENPKSVCAMRGIRVHTHPEAQLQYVKCKSITALISLSIISGFH
jgi:hypothetical protein